MGKIRKTNPRLFFSWLLSYVVILLVPVAVSGIVYQKSGRVIESEIVTANMAAMAQLQEVTDSYIKGLERISVEIGFDEKIVGLMNLKGSPNEYHQYEMTKLIENFKLYRVANNFIDYFYIYFRNNDFALSYSGKFDSAMLYEHIHEAPGLNYGSFKKLLEEFHLKDYIILQRKASTGEIVDSIAFIQSLPLQPSSEPPATLVAIIDMEQLTTLLENSKWGKEGITMIIDKNDKILASSGRKEMLPENLTYESLNSDSGFIYSAMNHQEVVVSYLDSSVTGWKYVSIIPNRAFFSKAEAIKNITIFSTLLCLCLGFFISYAFAQRNYNPLKSIIEVISEKSGRKFDKDLNEYGFIRTSLLDTIEQKNEAYKKLNSQNSILKTNFLLKLVKGTVDSSVPVEELLETYDISFCSDYFTVMLANIDDYINAEAGTPSSGSLKFARLIIGNISMELLSNRYKVFVVDEENVVISIINLKEDFTDNWRKDLFDTAYELQQSVKKQYGINVSISIGNLQQDCPGISLSFREALEAMEYKIVEGNGKIISYEDIKERSCSTEVYTYSLDTEQKFINCIKAGNFEGARLVMHEVIENSFYKHSLPAPMAKCLLFAMINTMINAVKELSIICEKGFLEEINPVERLLECKTVEEIAIHMDNILTKVGSYIEESNRSRGPDLWKDVMQYVNSNYSDINLSVSMIAAHFRVNPSYLSSYFKGKTGEGLLDFISKVRISKAKELLISGDISITDLAHKVGYYNINALIRTFKKLEGVTPGKFREMNT